MRSLEEKLGVRLLARTTRSVTTTEAGERLLSRIGPHFDEIDAEVAALGELRDQPTGHIRITADEHAATTALLPALDRVFPLYPDISIEIVTDKGLIDIVAERYDAGVRSGDVVAKDMIAIPIGPRMRMVPVAQPQYCKKHPKPKTPRELTGHNCINLRLPTLGGIYAWEFEKNGRELRVRTEGQLTLNSIMQVRQAAMAGYGVAFLSEELVENEIKTGALVPALTDWTAPFAGYHLYYPSRRQHTQAFKILVDALRYRS
jgi:DNA-binding transcriptional LysR family regulator